jgi:hypothetical protein
LQTFWQKVIEECEKENLPTITTSTSLSTTTSLPKKTVKDEKENLPTITTSTSLSTTTFFPKKTVNDEKENLPTITTSTSLSTSTSLPKKTVNDPESDSPKKSNLASTTFTSLSKKAVKDPELDKKNIKLITNFCYDVFHELKNKSYACLFYKYVEKDDTDKIIKNPMDLYTINSKLENDQYTSLKEFEEDFRLIFRNCYTYNNVESEIYHSAEVLETFFNEKWSEKLILRDRKTRELKRVREEDDDDTDNSFTSK